MALIKQQKQTSGVLANYWRITRVEFDASHEYINVTASLYLSKEERLAGSEPVVRTDVRFKPVTLDDLANAENLKVFCYDKLKTLPDFAGAEDDL